MRKYVTGVVSAFVALAGFTVFGAAAPFQSLKVHLSEAVHVAHSELPAGDYIVRYVDIGSDVPVLSFSPAKGGVILVTAMRNELPHAQLVQVQARDRAVAVELPPDSVGTLVVRS